MLKILQTFRESRGNHQAVDLARPLGLANCIPCLHDSPDLIASQARLLTDHKDTIFIITRSKNTNTVVYRYKEGLDPIDAFWYRFADLPDTLSDPARLREELTWIQRKMAYGISTQPSSGNDQFNTTLTACPSFPMTLVRDVYNQPRLLVKIDDQDCYLLRIYVQAKENILGFPTVIFTNLHVIDISTGQEMVVKVKP